MDAREAWGRAMESASKMVQQLMPMGASPWILIGRSITPNGVQAVITCCDPLATAASIRAELLRAAELLERQIAREGGGVILGGVPPAPLPSPHPLAPKLSFAIEKEGG